MLLLDWWRGSSAFGGDRQRPRSRRTRLCACASRHISRFVRSTNHGYNCRVASNRCLHLWFILLSGQWMCLYHDDIAWWWPRCGLSNNVIIIVPQGGPSPVVTRCSSKSPSRVINHAVLELSPTPHRNSSFCCAIVPLYRPPWRLRLPGLSSISRCSCTLSRNTSIRLSSVSLVRPAGAGGASGHLVSFEPFTVLLRTDEAL